MNLINQYVSDYIEFAKVCAPNDSHQSIPANTITTLEVDTEVADTGGIVGAPSGNKFTLPQGIYYFEGFVAYTMMTTAGFIFSLYNVTTPSYVTRSGSNTGSNSYGGSATLKGQMKLAVATQFELRGLCYTESRIGNGFYNETVINNSTANADQRATFRAWRIKG